MAERYRRKAGPAQYNYVPMEGRVCGTWTVLDRAPNVNGNARWKARHTCGAVHILEGIRLRSSPPRHCANCRPKKAGTVQRRTGA